jgi:predicted PurR-regulated permease PerM
MTQRTFLWILAGLGVLLCGWIAWPFLSAILMAATLAVALGPLQARLARAIASRSGAALATVLIFVAAAVLPAVFIAMAVTDDVRGLYSNAADLSWLNPWLDPWLARFGFSSAEAWARLQEQALASSRALVGTAASVAAGIGGGIATALITLFTLFYFLRDGHIWLREIVQWAPLERTQRERLLSIAHQTVLANVYGVLAVALAQGGLALVGYWLTGVPSGMLWAVVTSFFSLIPVVGSAAVWAPAVLYLWAKGKVGAAVFLAVWCGVLVSWSDNVVRPYVISESVSISPLLILFSLLGGMQAFGLVGLFIGPVAVALTGAVFRMLREANGATGSG